MQLKSKSTTPAKEWAIRHGGRTWGPLSLNALITLVQNEAFPACEAEACHADKPDVWKPIGEQEKLSNIVTIQREIEHSSQSLNRSRSRLKTHIVPNEPESPVLVEELIRASRLADTADFDRKPGTPEKKRETDDENDVINHLEHLSDSLESKKINKDIEAKRGVAFLKTLLILRLLCASAVASKTYFIMHGTREFLFGIFIFFPLIVALRWLLKATY